MNILDAATLQILMAGLVCGIFGQFVRSLIGLYKVHTNPATGSIGQEFDCKRFLISLAMGGTIGLIVSLIYTGPLKNTDLLSIVATSYAGADTLEGFLGKRKVS
ncbi:MAG: hypothetical protein PHQ43_13410 [Dehalococcoidales bacterium]|jgi:hypothetical protein|nr:hypothetical protein [Dehalococcoidales bacterium]